MGTIRDPQVHVLTWAKYSITFFSGRTNREQINNVHIFTLIVYDIYEIYKNFWNIVVINK